MKLTFNKENGTSETQNVASLIITLNSDEKIEITEESSERPPHLSEGVTVWGGRVPKEGASLDELKVSTRSLSVYPLAANLIHIFPLPK